MPKPQDVKANLTMTLAKIIPPEHKEGRFAAESNGTKVITPDGELRGVTNLSVHFEVGGPIRAEAELYCDVETIDGAGLEVWMRHPYTGGRVRIEAIVTTEGKIIKF